VSKEAARCNVKLFAATNGNHGRAMARMGRLLSLNTYIYIPSDLEYHVKRGILDEGAQIITHDDDYYAEYIVFYYTSQYSTLAPLSVLISAQEVVFYTRYRSLVHSQRHLIATHPFYSVNMQLNIFYPIALLAPVPVATCIKCPGLFS
jgi:cysteine synthase